jgi:hypothetical protein
MEPMTMSKAGSRWRAREFALAIAAASVCTPGFRQCGRSRVLLSPGSLAARTAWTVIKGESCQQFIGTAAWRFQGCLENLHIGARAVHGVAGVNNSHGGQGFAYKPEPAFTGADHFQVKGDYRYGCTGAAQAATIDVDIQVVGGR